MKWGIAIDPGVSTGIVTFTWSDDQPYERTSVMQVTDGAEGLADWLEKHEVRYSLARKRWLFRERPIDAFVMEKFTPHENAGHALTERSVEPLRCEGVVIAAGHSRQHVHWQQPAAQYFSGGTTPAGRKKASREFLKTHLLYLTGSQVGQPDADDAISATLHSIAYMRRIRHLPTLEKFFS